MSKLFCVVLCEQFYSLLDWVLTHWPISLHLDLFMFVCVYFVCSCFIMHSCCVIVSTVGLT